MSTMVNNFKLAGDILALVRVQLQMGAPNEEILVDTANQLADVWRDGRVYGQRKAIEDFTHALQGVITEYQEHEGEGQSK